MKFNIVHELRLGGQGGRLRLRHGCRFSPACAKAISESLARIAGINGVAANPVTGSVLFYYDSGGSRDMALEQMKAMPDQTLAAEGKTGRGSGAGRRALFSISRYLLMRFFAPPFLRVLVGAGAAMPFLYKGLRGLAKGRLHVETLDAAAIGISLCRRDFRTVSALTLLLTLGETLEEWTRQRSVQSLSESIALKVDKVCVLDSQHGEKSVPIADIRPGDLVIVRQGSAIPVDGTVADGKAMVNQASFTGEPLAVAKGKGASVFSGTVVEDGQLVIKTQKTGKDTRLNKILGFLDESEKHKSGIEARFIHLANMAVPFTFALAGLVWLITRDPMRAASVLLVDFSCSFKLATPIAVLAAMREGVNNGIAIKGGKYLEALSEADTAVFDKTGTLTHARPQVARVIPAPGWSADEVLRAAACLEEHFPHPVARAVTREAERKNLRHEEEHAEVRYILAHGIASTLNGKSILIGSRHFIGHDEGVDLSPLKNEIENQAAAGRTILYLAAGDKLAGLIAIEDKLRSDAAPAIKELRGLGIKRIIMLTGDGQRTAAAVAAEAGITEFFSEILPEDKANIIAGLGKEGRKTMMIGDGINDAPALSRASVGISMSDGTDLAQAVANVILTRPQLSGLALARKLSRSAMARIRHNFFLSLGLNSLFLLGGISMLLSPGLAALLHNLATIGISLNAMRPMLCK